MRTESVPHPRALAAAVPTPGRVGPAQAASALWWVIVRDRPSSVQLWGLSRVSCEAPTGDPGADLGP